MDKLSYLHTEQAHQSEDRREALRWLARRLQWEHRLGELRPGAERSALAA
jgi:hypothetical protein